MRNPSQPNCSFVHLIKTNLLEERDQKLAQKFSIQNGNLFVSRRIFLISSFGVRRCTFPEKKYLQRLSAQLINFDSKFGGKNIHHFQSAIAANEKLPLNLLTLILSSLLQIAKGQPSFLSSLVYILKWVQVVSKAFLHA